MDNPYFTLASLPHLEADQPSPFEDWDAFWDYVDHVPSEWRADFEAEVPSHPTVAAFRQWDVALRTALAKARLESLPWKDRADLPAGGGEWAARAQAVLNAGTPLEAEIRLDNLRWELVDDLGQGHQFDKTAFFTYALKLQLVLRRSRLVLEQGQDAFDALHASVLAKTDLTIRTGEQS